DAPAAARTRDVQRRLATHGRPDGVGHDLGRRAGLGGIDDRALPRRTLPRGRGRGRPPRSRRQRRRARPGAWPRPAGTRDLGGTEPRRLPFAWERQEAVMAAWIWILIAIGALVVLGLVVFGARRNREKTQRREQAQELR